MSEDNNMFYCSFVSIHYIICECGETFPNEDDLRGHLEKEHASKKERKEYKCGACERVFRSEEGCIKHYEDLHLHIQDEHDYVETVIKKESDDLCEEDEEQKYSVEQVTELIDSELIAQNSEYNEHDSEFTEHEFIEDDSEYIEDSEFIEEGSEYVDGIEYVEDFSGFVEDEPEDVKPDISNEKVKRKAKKKSYNKKDIVCEVCGKKYASNAALRYHQRVHTGERPYQCTMCPKSFTMPLFLQIHLRTHTGERPYQCQLCPKAFSNKAALLRHDRVHTGVKPYACPKCGKTFTQSNSMKLHVNTVHYKMPAPYKSKARRNKALEREIIRAELAKDMKQENEETITEVEADPSAIAIQYVKEEDLYENVEGEEILYEDVDSKAITYEIIYE